MSATKRVGFVNLSTVAMTPLLTSAAWVAALVLVLIDTEQHVYSYRGGEEQYSYYSYSWILHTARALHKSHPSADYKRVRTCPSVPATVSMP